MLTDKRPLKLPSHNILTMLALLAGLITAFTANPALENCAEIVAEISIRIMRLVAVPILFLSIVASAAHFKNFDDIRVLGRKIIKYTLLTTMLAALVAEALYWLVAPLLLDASLSGAQSNATAPGSFMTTIIAMIPDNMTRAFLENNVLAIVVMAIFLAMAILTIKPAEKEVVFSFFVGLQNALMRIVHVGLKFLPLSVWAFVSMLAKQIIDNDADSINAIGGLMFTVIAANLIQGLVVIPLLLSYKKISPWRLAYQVKEALILAFFTRSSSATLPVTLEHAIRDAHIREDVARLSLPLCTTINMNGCAQFILLSTYFVSAFTGHIMLWWEHAGMILISVIAAVGNAGVPMGCFFLASSILASKNIPLHLMGSILPLYTFIDMVETSLNVWSDVSVAKIVDSETKS